MKNFYPPSSRILLTLVIVLCSHLVPKAQVLSVGDIAFTGYTSGGAVDSFSFVLLTNIPSGTSINFTDDAWLGAAFSGGEETVTWTSGAAMTAGREITIFGLTAIVAGAPISPGTVTGTPINLTTSGDQILAYQDPPLPLPSSAAFT
ncbi:MAG: hypothetical protein IPI66_01070 [Chitinophagaceae bacterium]|nr:hypothetical protein [Chitinophagaceae bacterium]